MQLNRNYVLLPAQATASSTCVGRRSERVLQTKLLLDNIFMALPFGASAEALTCKSHRKVEELM